MKEYLKRMRPCPFCGHNSFTFTWIDQLTDKITGKDYCVLHHYCDPVEPISTVITIYGDTENDCIERWNADDPEYSAK